MADKRWKRFDALTEKCYSDMAGTKKGGDCWQQAFELLKEIVRDERQKTPGAMSRLELVDEETDYEYCVQEWIEDCLDEMDMRGEQKILLKMCDELLDMFGWTEYTGSDIRFRKASALGALGRKKEAADFCRKWIRREPENIVAATAGVYAFAGTGEYEAAEELVERFIFDRTQCSDETDIMFMAVSTLYAAMGKAEEKKQIDDAIAKYEEEVDRFFEEFEFADIDDMDDWDDIDDIDDEEDEDDFFGGLPF